MIFIFDLGKIAYNTFIQMNQPKQIKNALISVFNKDGLDTLVKKLNELNINIYSTGGTEKYISNLNIKVNKVEDTTGFPSILGGRVKTLHPNVFGGILSRRDNESDQRELQEYQIEQFDLVVECLVRGVEDREWGKRIVAYIKPTTIDVEKLKQFVQERLEPYSIPKEWHLVNELPLSEMGKPNN